MVTFQPKTYQFWGATGHWHCGILGRTEHSFRIHQDEDTTAMLPNGAENPSKQRHESSSFKNPLLCNWIFMHSCCQTDGTCSLTCGVDYSWRNLLDVFQELRFGSTWVSQKEHVNVSSDFMFSADIFWDTTKHGKNNTFLDELMAIYTWSDRVEDFLLNISLFGELLNSNLVLVSNFDDVFITESSHIVCLNDGVEDREPVLDVSSIVEFVDENTCDFNRDSDPANYKNMFTFLFQSYHGEISLCLHYFLSSSLLCQINIPAALFSEVAWQCCYKEFKAFLIGKNHVFLIFVTFLLFRSEFRLFHCVSFLEEGHRNFTLGNSCHGQYCYTFTATNSFSCLIKTQQH